MKKLIVGLIAVVLVGCSPSATEKKFEVLPDELKDCKFFRLHNSDGVSITVARCPNSTTSTTYAEGKTTATTIVVDGVEYVKK